MKHAISSILVTAITFLPAISDAQTRVPVTQDHWVATWSTAQDLAPTVMDAPVVGPNVKRPDFSGQRRTGPRTDVPAKLQDQTIRMVAHTSIGGSKVRIELSNAFGKSPVTFGSVHVALRKSGSEIVEGSDRTVLFSGKSSITLRPGVIAFSDPIALALAPFSDLAVSLYVPTDSGAPTTHTLGLHAAYVAGGDKTGSSTIPDPTTTTYAYLWLAGVDVAARPSAFAIVALGDSITDGFKTTRDADQAWPTLLAERLSANKSSTNISVLNEGISGNEVLRDGAGVSALARFDRDVLSRPGVKWVVVLEGINDINIHGQVTGPDALTADDLIAGYQQLIARSHAYGIKIVGATVMAEEGVWLTTPIGEATRQVVNKWIKTSHAFDAIVDLDAVTRDPKQEDHLKAEFDSGDHIHPNDAGNKAMADAFDLAVFK